jgi:hypothetical protein
MPLAQVTEFLKPETMGVREIIIFFQELEEKNLSTVNFLFDKVVHHE